MSSFVDRLKSNRFLTDFFTGVSLNQFKRYLVTGFSSAIIELSILYILKSYMQFSVIAANSIALTIVFWFNFLMNRYWSFKSRYDLRKQLIMYGILFLFNLGASDVIMYILTSLLYMQYILSKIFAIGAVVSWNFILYKKVIYK